MAVVYETIDISLNFVPKSPINNIPVLVQIMAWRQPVDKPLSEGMLTSSRVLDMITYVPLK